MQGQMTIRICSTCHKPLDFHKDGFQEGVLCCDLYYHEGACLDKSFEGSGTTWEDHYTDDGDCYFSDWEPEYQTDEEIAHA